MSSKPKIPKSILNAPELQRDLALFYNSFWDLDTCRNSSDGPISWLAIQSYCNEFDIIGSQREDFFYHIKSMDRVYRNFSNSKDGKTAKTKGAIGGKS